MSSSGRLDRQAMRPTLISAIRSLDVDTVEKLLKLDFEIEYRNSDHHSVLHTAVSLINLESVAGGSYLLKKVPDKLRNSLSELALPRIVQDLLESARFNVNSLDSFSRTALHFAAQYCKCRLFTCDEYKDIVNAIIELLLKNDANINARTSLGETPLMKASELGCSHIVQLLLDWRYEFGTGVDLNARDMCGETALIKAAKGTHVDVVELLLQHGCLDEFHDHRGFYALHAVIYGSELIDDVSSDFLGSIGIDASEKTLLFLVRYKPEASELGKMIIKNLNKNDDIQKIVGMLVTSGRANVDSKDFLGNTVLDVAFRSNLRISQETIEMIMKCGSTFCTFANRYLQNPRHTVQIINKLGKTPLHRLSVILPQIYAETKLEILDSEYLLNSNPYKELFEAMAVAKDYRGRTALHYAVNPILSPFEGNNFILKKILNVTRIINERDNYGRTPLHYFQHTDIYRVLVEQGADEQVLDIDGYTPQDLKQLRRVEDFNRYLEKTMELQLCIDAELNKMNGDQLDSQLENLLNKRKLDACTIWKESKCAYRDQFSTIMCDKIRKFMDRLSEEIGKKDPRFECRPVLIGSAEEGTKIGLPDEFDFNFVLTKLSELCEVVPSPEAPSGFVHLKRRSYNAELWHANQDFNDGKNFKRFFSNDGFLLTAEITSRFRILYLQILNETEFWDGEHVFEWVTPDELGFRYYEDKEECCYEFTIPNDFRPSVHPCSNIRLKLNRPIEGRYMFTDISLDIVPCIKINDWWPEEALTNISDEIKCEGCHLVFDQPQRKYLWVPFSDPFARISFAQAEDRLIKQCPAVARAAYMVGKQLLFYCSRSKFTYVLKTCLLYCIEALKDCTSNSLIYEDINPTELRYFVEKLMLCFHEFYLQDFFPCYMMPSFHLPIEGYFKSTHDSLMNESIFRYPSFGCMLYKIACIAKSEVDGCNPTLHPLNEHFNREELLRKLSVDNRSSVEHRRVQPKRFVKEQKIRSDSKSELHVRSETSRKRRKQKNADRTKVKRQKRSKLCFHIKGAK